MRRRYYSPLRPDGGMAGCAIKVWLLLGAAMALASLFFGKVDSLW
jgi:hypothetical protein